MSEITIFQWIMIVASYLAIILPVLASIAIQIRKRAQQDMKINEIGEKHKEFKKNITKDLNDMEIRHTLDVQEIKVSIIDLGKTNIAQHGSIFQGQNQTNESLAKLSRDVSELTGYLRGKEKK